MKELRRDSRVVLAEGRVTNLSSKNFQLKVKRGIDFLAAAVLLVILSPILLAIALAVRLTLGSPILFRQRRIGREGRLFTMLKFRTMTEECDAHGRLLADELRLTPFGRFLRSTTLDELPELLNIIRGDMSFVGPRALLVEYKDLYSPEQWRRHEMRPGMAGPVLAAGRNLLSWEEKFERDVWYVDNWSLTLDLKILLTTALKVVKREGVAAEGHATMPPFLGTKRQVHDEDA